MAMDRRLAAIFAADVAGYSRLMAGDEEGTLARLKHIRSDIVDPLIAAHHGRIFKTTGDGLLAEFASVIEAVRCAVAVQRTAEENRAAVSAEDRLELRIGIHVGDVIIDGTDIFGDGVNIAARLEALADPGGICVSARVYEDAVGRTDAEFEYAGEPSLKNIGRAVRMYRVRPAAAPTRESGPTVAPALASTVRRIGFLGVAPRPIYNEFKRALAAYGHVDGRTVEIVHRWCNGDYERYPDLVRELIDLDVALIVASATPAVSAAKQATSTVPIVMVEVGDPVAYGIVPSLLRPGGNVTGMSNGLFEYAPRVLRLFKEIVPNSARVVFLSPSIKSHPAGRAWADSMEGVAHALDLISRIYYADSADEIRGVIGGIDRRTDVLVAAPDHGLLVNRTVIISAAMDLKVPVVCPQPDYVRDGALLSLDPDRREIFRRVAYYVDAILKGAKPRDLPVEEPRKDWLMLNLRTAQLLNIEIPGPILMRADEVIE